MKYTISIWGVMLVWLDSNYDGLWFEYDIHNQNILILRVQSVHFYEYTLQLYNYSR